MSLFAQPLAGLQTSAVQTSPSLGQLSAGPPMQVPTLLQVSLVVQRSPSSQAVPLGFTGSEHTPVTASHVPTAWQESNAVHTTGLPATQPLAGAHVSTPLQALPSSQVRAVPATQPLAGLQVSTPLQALLSLQTRAVPATQPVAGAQVSTPLQALLSLHTRAAPPTQDPPEQVSAVVHAFPSSQDAVLFVLTQPVAGTHESFVQGLLSLQLRAVPATHPLAGLQVSTPLQALLSLQTRAVPATQPLAGLQVSTPLHALLSSQVTGV
jgi:hypothetical protein